MKVFFERYFSEDFVVYDVGCGSKPFSSFLSGKVKAHVGVDLSDGFYDQGYVDKIGSAYDVPAEDGEADAVISSQVLEHLSDPHKALQETARILKPGGIFCLSFPFLYQMHALPRDYNRYSEYMMSEMFEKHGFELLEQKRLGGFWYMQAIFITRYLVLFDRGLLKKLRIIKALSWFFSWIFTLMHKLEGLMIKMVKKNPEDLRQIWTVNYVMVAKKL